MYKYCKKLKEGTLAEGENPYSVIRVDEESLAHYLSEGHKEATEEEYLADNPLGETEGLAEESSEVTE